MMKLLCWTLLFFCWITPGQTKGPVVVKEGQDVVLPCSLSSKENIETTVVHWKKDGLEVFFYSGGHYSGQGISGQDKQFEDRASHFNDELKNGNASIKISETKVTDSGVYTCKFPHLQPPQEFNIELVVEPVFKDRSGENPTASPKPNIETLPQIQDWVPLQCEVLGASPEPKLEWRDSSGNLLPAEETQRSFTGGKYDLTIQANVTKSGNYLCVLKQEGIYHNISSKTFVPVRDNNGWFGGLAVGLAVGLNVGALVMAAVLTLPLRCSPSLRYRVIDFLSRLKPRREQDKLMDPGKREQNGVTKYHDEDESGPLSSRQDSGIPLKSSNGSTT